MEPGPGRPRKPEEHDIPASGLGLTAPEEGRSFHRPRRSGGAEVAVLKVPDEVDQILVAKAYEADQQHVFEHWAALDATQRRALLDQLRTIDFQLMKRLAASIDKAPEAAAGAVHGLDISPLSAGERARLAEVGREALRAGRVACVVVAGGQGTRLGWNAPKGTFPVAPVTGKSLFQLFGEQLQALSRRAGRPIRWYVLTSRQNRDETEAFFQSRGFFGLPREEVVFLVQRELPTFDLQGRLLMTSKHELAMNPDGHGGTIRALREARALVDLGQRGVDVLYYFQVDNPLVRIADPAFVGAHLEAQADASTKVVRKVDPAERIGLLVERDGHTGVVEYSELGKAEQAQRDASGALVFRAGNTAIHAWSVPFLDRLEREGFELEYHIAKKVVPALGPDGETVTPAQPNAIKFETFIFDLLPAARKHVAFEVAREDEFEPLKNATGEYSPVTVKAAQSARAARWLADAGQVVPPAAKVVELSPLTALDPEELRGKALALTPSEGKLAV